MMSLTSLKHQSLSLRNCPPTRFPLLNGEWLRVALAVALLALLADEKALLALLADEKA